MRIISGKYRGRRIHPPPHMDMRPTTDMAKEALFNILCNYYDFEEVKVLDLFCGSGSLSYEFISRGSTDVTAVDLNTRCIDFIKKTATSIGMEGLQAMKADAFKFLERSNTCWDIIIADPPYIMKESLMIPGIIAERKLLSKHGRLIIEHPSEISFAEETGFLEKRSYSRVQFSFFNFGEEVGGS